MPILFDLDGTLIDSESAHKEAEVETFAGFGLNFTVDDLFRFTGVPYRTMIAEVAPEIGTERFLEAHRDRLISFVGSRILPFDDAMGCLSLLGEKRLGLATSSPSWYVKAVLEAFPQFQRFSDYCICGDDVTDGKPSPEPFQKCAARFGEATGDCFAIEDSKNGVASAKAAGCFTVGIRRDERLDLTQADEIVDSLLELPDLIARRMPH